MHNLNANYRFQDLFTSTVEQSGYVSGLLFDDVTVFGVAEVSDVIVNNSTHSDWTFTESTQVN